MDGKAASPSENIVLGLNLKCLDFGKRSGILNKQHVTLGPDSGMQNFVLAPLFLDEASGPGSCRANVALLSV